MPFDIHIVGGGLAGSEAAWQLAEAGFRVRLSEMRGGGDMTPAHETDRLAEMVCSNSFRSDDADNNAVGLLHQEMRALDSLILRAAGRHRVPAGSALAVDRELFAAEVTRAIDAHPNITVVRERVDALPDHPAIIATGPLTGPGLAEAIARETGSDALAFFDAIAPIVWPSSTPSPPSSTATASTCRCAGWRRDGTRAGRITSTARWTRRNMTPSSRP
jgi:methylenetetrahydrofolate--tRNA-(uracil-5-)-methyltransferase